MPDPNSSSTEHDLRPSDRRARSRRLDVHPNTVKRLIHMRELKAYRVGRQLRVDPKDLDAFLQRVIEQKQQQPGDLDPAGGLKMLSSPPTSRGNRVCRIQICRTSRVLSPHSTTTGKSWSFASSPPLGIAASPR